MRKHRRRQSRSNNGTLKRDGYRNMLEADPRRLWDEVLGIGTLNESDKAANAEGEAIIRRGKSASDNKAFRDSILWNSNIRKLWIRRAIELSDNLLRRKAVGL